MRKVIYFLLTLGFIFTSSVVYGQSTIIKEVKSDDLGTSVRVSLVTNSYTTVEYYDIATPPQIVIDFIGNVFTNLRDAQIIDNEPIKQIRFVKGTETAGDLDDSYYAVDFIIIDMEQPKPYEFFHGQNVVSVEVKKAKPRSNIERVSKLPVSEITTPEMRKPVEPELLLPVEEEAVGGAPALRQEKTENEITLPLLPAIEEPVEELPREGMIKKSWSSVSSGTKSIGRNIWRGAASIGRGVKKIFALPKMGKKVKKREVKQEKEDGHGYKNSQAGLAAAIEEKNKAEALLKKAVDDYMLAQAELGEVTKTQHQPDEKFDMVEKEAMDAQQELAAAVEEEKKVKEEVENISEQYKAAKKELNLAISKQLDVEELERLKTKYENKKQEFNAAIAQAKLSNKKVKEKTNLNKQKQQALKSQTRDDQSRSDALKKARTNLELAKDKMERMIVEVKKSEIKVSTAKREYGAWQLRKSKKSLANEYVEKPHLPEKPEITCESARNLRNKGFEAQSRGDLDQAVRYYQEAILADSTYPDPHNDLGIVYEQKGWRDRAKGEYLTVLKIAPDYIKAYSNLALLYEQEGNIEKAIYYWQERVRLGNPGDKWTEVARKRMEELKER
ncbi:MAG: tetratricopeptide repeat protein [Candidatus Omnitrophota bacterium]